MLFTAFQTNKGGKMLRECTSRRVAEEFVQNGGCILLPIDAIRFKCGKQLDAKKVEKIARHLASGGATVPIAVKQNRDGGFHIVGEGRHRVEAHRRAERTRILCRIAA